MASLLAQRVKHLPTMRETWVRSLEWEDPLEKETAPYSRTLAWKMPWMEKPGRLQSMGSQRVGYNWAASLSFLREWGGGRLQKEKSAWQGPGHPGGPESRQHAAPWRECRTSPPSPHLGFLSLRWVIGTFGLQILTLPVMQLQNLQIKILTLCCNIIACSILAKFN